METCFHCGESIEIRNLSMYCDHLYYPDNCIICKCLERLRESKNVFECKRILAELQNKLEWIK